MNAPIYLRSVLQIIPFMGRKIVARNMAKGFYKWTRKAVYEKRESAQLNYKKNTQEKEQMLMKSK